MGTRAAWISVLILTGTSTATAQSAPDIVWQAATPGLGSNSVTAVDWSPLGDAVAVGSTDRWFRVRRARDGALGYSLLEPPNSHGPGQIVYSTDSALVGVENRAFGMSFRVQRSGDGQFLGSVIASVDSDGLMRFAPDATLRANTGGDGTISRWPFAEFTFFRVTGSGYQTLSTAFDFSPDGQLQTATSRIRITVRQRSDGTIVRVLPGGTMVEFSPDSALLAVWSSASPDEIKLWRTSDGVLLRTLTSSTPNEGVAAMRFTQDGQRLVSTGYDPYLDANGLWQQKGFIRFWRVSDGSLLSNFDQQTDIAVTSPVSWSPSGGRFVYGLSDGTVAVAQTPP